MSTLLQPCYEDHESQGYPSFERWTILPHQGPSSLHSLQMSKGHSSTEKAKKSPFKPPNSESSHHASPTRKSTAAPSVFKNPETISPYIPEPHPSSTQPGPSTSHLDRLITLIKGLHDHIFGLANVMYSHHNHVQICLTTIEAQLDEIQCKLMESLLLSVPKRGRTLTVNIMTTA